MRILEGDPAGWPPAAAPSAVSIGIFDGVHRGHQEVLDDLQSQAAERDLVRAVLTFVPHPLDVVDPDRAPRLLGTVEQRLEWLAERDIDIVGVLPFRRVREMTPEEFIRRVLVEALAARVVVVGVDFRFGVDRSGSVATLRRWGGELGFDVDAIPLLSEAHSPLSSSRIRLLVAEGDMAGAGALLGRPFTMRGTVVEGDGRGRSIGVPTANLSFGDRMLVPGRGVYAARVAVDRMSHPAVVNVGVRPTFSGEAEVVEAHLLDAEIDLYDRTIDVAFVERIRDERRFDSADDLVAQIGRDIEVARRALSAHASERTGDTG